jgi:hypothetical protein
VLIQPKFLSLTDLLANRLFRIPQYQRSYSWSSKELVVLSLLHNPALSP